MAKLSPFKALLIIANNVSNIGIANINNGIMRDVIVTFLNPNNDISSMIIDNGEYVTLKIQTNNYIESKTITYDNTKLVLDQSSAVLKNISSSTNDTKNSFIIPKVNLEENTIYELYFIKVDANSSIELGNDIIIN